MAKDLNSMNGIKRSSNSTNSWNKAKVNVQNADGDTSLHLAVRIKNVASIQHLLEKGANPNLQNARGNTPLYENLAFVCDNDLANSFLQCGAKVDLKNCAGENALHLAVRAEIQRNKYEFVEKLLDTKLVNVNEANEHDQTVMHLILENCVAPDEIPKFMKLFVERGANVDVVDAQDKTPFYLAVGSKHEGAIKYLLKRGVDVNGHGECVPLFKALENNDPPLFKQLVTELKARTDVKSGAKRQTLLHAAIRHIDDERGRFELVRLLIKDGEVDVNDRDAEGYTAIQCALERRDKDVFDYLALHGGLVDVKNNRGESLLYTAVSGKMFEVARTLIAKGVEVNDCDSRGVSVLQSSVLQDDVKLFRLLLASGADVDRTALLTVVRFGSPKMLNLIETTKREVDHGSSLGRELLVTAVARNRVEMLHYLLETGADVNSKYKGLLPLRYAYEAVRKNCRDDSSVIKNMKNTSIQILVDHIAVLKSLNAYVSHDNAKLIDETPSLKMWFDFCNAELEKMKTRRVLSHCELTFYDLLTGDRKNEAILRMTSMDCMQMLEKSESDDFYTFFEDYTLELEIGLSGLATRVLKHVVPINVVRDILDRYGVRDFGILYDSEEGDLRKRYQPRNGWFANCLNKIVSTYAWLSKTFTDILYDSESD